MDKSLNIFTFETTSDGSPTLRIGAKEDLSEAMHSLKGAFSETLYIYGTAIETAIQQGFAPRILSMGLGLGYVEILAAALLLKLDRDAAGNTTGNAAIESFEILPELRDRLIAWLTGPSNCPDDFAAAYEDILARTAQETGQSADVIRSYLRELHTEGRWRLRDALTAETSFNAGFGCICFDAFSSKSTPDVWGEDFLKNFLAKTADTKCVLSTYACTGSLKRALREAGFALTIRPGFSSKRDSTFAVKTGAQNISQKP